MVGKGGRGARFSLAGQRARYHRKSPRAFRTSSSIFFFNPLVRSGNSSISQKATKVTLGVRTEPFGLGWWARVVHIVISRKTGIAVDIAIVLTTSGRYTSEYRILQRKSIETRGSNSGEGRED